jgi:predicted ArsR family transcriptional regulator
VAHPASGMELLRSDVRRRLLEILADPPTQDGTDRSPRERGLSAAELAAILGLHVTTVRFHVDQLVAAGILVARNDRPTRAGRPRKLFSLPTMSLQPPEDPAAQEAYRRLGDLLSSAIAGREDSIVPEEAGYRWAVDRFGATVPESERHPAESPGAWLAKIGRLVDVLADWGYAPDVRTRNRGRATEVVLGHCPFLALADAHPEVTCGVHRGLLRGVLESLGEDATVRLEPFVTPDTCVAYLSPRAPFRDPGGIP